MRKWGLSTSFTLTRKSILKTNNKQIRFDIKTNQKFYGFEHLMWLFQPDFRLTIFVEQKLPGAVFGLRKKTNKLIDINKAQQLNFGIRQHEIDLLS